MMGASNKWRRQWALCGLSFSAKALSLGVRGKSWSKQVKNGVQPAFKEA